MVLSADKERVKSLLKETITLLCRNGLAFKSKFSIEALIGVTLDEEDIFLISINELIKSDTNSAIEKPQSCNEEASEESVSDSGSSEGKSHHRTRKRRRVKRASIKQEPSGLYSGTCNQEDEQQGLGQAEGETEGGNDVLDGESPVKKSHDSTEDINSQDGDDSKDIVFIKEEVDTWSNNTTNATNTNISFQDTSVSQSNVNLSLSDINLIPVSSHDDSGMMWQSNRQHPASYRRRSSTMTTTSSVQQLTDMQMSGQQSRQVPESWRSRQCHVCEKVYKSKTALRCHLRIHFGKRRFSCPYCQREFYNKDNLQGHIVSHTGRKQFQCAICRKEYRYRTDYLHHMKVKHSPRRPGTLLSQSRAEN